MARDASHFDRYIHATDSKASCTPEVCRPFPSQDGLDGSHRTKRVCYKSPPYRDVVHRIVALSHILKENCTSKEGISVLGVHRRHVCKYWRSTRAAQQTDTLGPTDQGSCLLWPEIFFTRHQRILSPDLRRKIACVQAHCMPCEIGDFSN